MKESFSSRLKELLDEGGRGTASSVATACNVDRGYISQLATGARDNPSHEVVTCMANFFGCNVSWLRDGSGPRMKRLHVKESDSDNILREDGVRYGAVKGKPVASVATLGTKELWEMIEGLPSMIAMATNDTVRQRLASDAEAAAHELRERTNR